MRSFFLAIPIAMIATVARAEPVMCWSGKPISDRGGEQLKPAPCPPGWRELPRGRDRYWAPPMKTPDDTGETTAKRLPMPRGLKMIPPDHQDYIMPDPWEYPHHRARIDAAVRKSWQTEYHGAPKPAVKP